MYSINIVKESATGERIVLEACTINKVTGEHSLTKNELWKASKELCEVADNRMEEMNMRMIGAYKLVEMLPMQYRIMFNELMGVITGNVSAAQLQHRWKSVIEENEALAKGREEALAAQSNGEDHAKVVS